VGNVNLGAAERADVGVNTSCPSMKPEPPIAKTSASALSPFASRHLVVLSVTVETGASVGEAGSLSGTTELSSSQSIGTSFEDTVESNFSIGVEREQVLVDT
jgi:hypothetical protein